MIDDRDVDLAIRDLVREDVELSAAGLQDALDEVAQTPQVSPRRWWPFRRPARRSAPVAGFAVAGAIVALLVLAFGLLPFDGEDAVPAPATTPTPSVEVEPSLTPSPAPATLTVDAAGNGDFETIAEAVEAAVDGDVIEIRPGVYVGGIIIDKDIALRGDPTDAAAVVVRADPDAVQDGLDDLGFLMVDSNGSVGHLTVEDASGFEFLGGAPTVHDVVVTGDGLAGVDMEAAGVIRDSRGTGVGVTGGATTLFERNDLRGEGDDPSSVDISGFGSAPRFVGNRLPSVEVGEGSAVFEDNDILVSLDGCAARVVDPFSTATFRGNRFSDDETSICLLYGASASVLGNEFTGGEGGVSVQSGSSATLDGNTFVDVDTAVFVEAGAHANVVRNRIERGTVGIQTSRFPVEGGTPISPDDRAQGFIEDNSIVDVGSVAIELDSSNHQVGRNVIEGGPVGISIFNRGSPSLEENRVSGTSTAGIKVRGDARPAFVDTVVCGNAADFDLPESTGATVRRTVTCEEDLAAPLPSAKLGE